MLGRDRRRERREERDATRYQMHAQGNFVEHEYTFGRDGDKVAEVSMRWFRVRDTYGVEVFPDQNDILILAATAVIDTMVHPDR